MRTGAIFARGSCRALKWMALFGVVFVLGAGSALAQVSIDVPKTVDEAGRLTITVTANVQVAGRTDKASTLMIEPTVESGTTVDAKGVSAAEDADYTTPAGLTIDVKENGGEDPVDRELKGTIVLQTLPDLDAEDEALLVSFSLSGVDGSVTAKGSATTVLALDGDSDGNFAVTINDTDDQAFEWDAPDKPKEGSDIVVKLKADPAPVDLTYSVPLSIDTAGYTLNATTATLAAATSTATITIDPPDSDGDRENDTITLRALKAGTITDLIDPLEIEVADIHMLPADDKITAKAFQDDGKGKITKNEAMSVMEGGDPVHVTITVDRGDDNYPSGEKLKVEVMAADAAQGSDYRVDDDEFELDAEKGKQSMDIKLWARDDDDVGEEMLMLNLVVSGTEDDNGPGQSMGMFSIAIEDATSPLVEAKSQADVDAAIAAALAEAGIDGLNPDECVELMTGDLFTSAEGVAVAYSAASDGASVSVSVSGSTVKVCGVSAGEANVTVTATGTPPAAGATISQTVSNVAQISFGVTVALVDLAITLSGPEDMNVVEGMSYTLTATANRAVEMDTMVELVQTDGTASPSDYTVENITIMAGEMMGSTMLMVTADEMMENDGNMAEMLTLEGRFADDQDSDAMKTNAVMFYLWDAAVPALPIIAQLLLAAFLAIGGYRRYLRR